MKIEHDKMIFDIWIKPETYDIIKNQIVDLVTEKIEQRERLHSIKLDHNDFHYVLNKTSVDGMFLIKVFVKITGKKIN